jgi:hypothetical protein
MSIPSIVSRRQAARTAGLAALAAVAVGAPPLAPRAAAQDGVTFTYRVQSTAGERRDQPSPSILATVRLAGPNARMDFREGSMPMTREGGYIIIRGAEKSLVMVNTKEKKAMVIGVEGLGTAAGAMTNNALVKVSTRDQRFAFEDLGAGERILGHPTRRVKLSWGGQTEIRVLGKRNTNTESSTGEAWIATEVKGVDAEALRGWSRAFGAGVRRTNPDLVREMEEFDRRFGTGLALRSVVVSTNTDDKGKATTDTLRMEVTDLSRARLDASLFEVPKDYEVVDTRQMAAALDSARQASGMDTVDMGKAAKDAAKESGKDAAKDAVKGALGGLLRRKKP